MSSPGSSSRNRGETRLIVNADDFGLTPGVNQAILELAKAGAVTSATLMAASAAVGPAADRARQTPTLGIGCHVVLVDGAPVLPPGEIPSLIDPDCEDPDFKDDAAFRPTLGGFFRDLLRGRIREAEIEAEARAQIARLQSTGVAVTHADTHKHTHVFPRVLRPLLRAAVLSNVPCVRNPFEPDWSLAATPGGGAARRMQIRALRTQLPGFLKAVRQNGLVTTDGAVGVLATGTLDAATLRSLLAAMPPGDWELVCHPGHQDAALEQVRTRLRASREVERDALMAVVPLFAEANAALSLINFRQLAHDPD